MALTVSCLRAFHRETSLQERLASLMLPIPNALWGVLYQALCRWQQFAASEISTVRDNKTKSNNQRKLKFHLWFILSYWWHLTFYLFRSVKLGNCFLHFYSSPVQYLHHIFEPGWCTVAMHLFCPYTWMMYGDDVSVLHLEDEQCTFLFPVFAECEVIRNLSWPNHLRQSNDVMYMGGCTVMT